MEFVVDPAEEQAAEAERGLDRHNAGLAYTRSTTRVRAVFVESGRVVAGLDSAAYWGKLHVRVLWVHPDHRSKGLGSRLMDWAEQRGRELDCVSVMANTMSFQAPGFYAGRGYRALGLSTGYEGGTSRHYFEKYLQALPPAGNAGVGSADGQSTPHRAEKPDRTG